MAMGFEVSPLARPLQACHPREHVQSAACSEYYYCGVVYLREQLYRTWTLWAKVFKLEKRNTFGD